MQAHPENYPPLIGDKMPDSYESFSGEQKNPALTTNYISSLAEFKPLEESLLPTLQVLSSNMDFETSLRGGDVNSLHFTHLSLRDGSNDVMTGRLSMHLAHRGDNLAEADIIQLNSFTPITYMPSGPGKPQRSPAVVVHTFSKVGYDIIPNALNDPIHCIDLTSQQIEEYTLNSLRDSVQGSWGDELEELEEVTCTSTNRYCARYGLSPVFCVCQTDPVSKIKLETVRQYCWFATTDVSKMKSSWKRNMLYWWYMTNIYNISGKGHRQEPPACLKAAIQQAYPSDDGQYKVYKLGNMKQKK